MTLSILPDELILDIAKYFASDWYQPDVDPVPRHYYLDYTLLSLCALNRRIRTICFPVQFRVLSIGLEIYALDLEREFLQKTLLSRPDVTTLLRSVHLRQSGPSDVYMLDIQWIHFERIVQDLLRYAPSLIHLDIKFDPIIPPITLELIKVINEHPSLKTVAIDSSEQLHHLDNEAIHSTSLSRINCRHLVLFNSPRLQWEALGIMFRPGDGARLSKLVMYDDTPQAWQSMSLNGLEIIEFHATPSSSGRLLDLQQSSFLSRTPSLRLIKVIGQPSSLPLKSPLLARLPCMTELYAAATAEGVQDSIGFEGLVTLERTGTPGLRDENTELSPWCVQNPFLTLTKAGVLSLPLFTETVPFTKILSIAIEDTDADTTTIHDIFDALKTSHLSLQEITTIELLPIPLWESDSDEGSAADVPLGIGELDFAAYGLDENHSDDRDKAWDIVEPWLQLYLDYPVQFLQDLGALCPLLESVVIYVGGPLVEFSFDIKTTEAEEGSVETTVIWSIVDTKRRAQHPHDRTQSH